MRLASALFAPVAPSAALAPSAPLARFAPLALAVLSWGALALAVGSSALAEESTAAPQGLDAARVAFSDGDLDACVTLCEAIPAKSDDRPGALYLRGEALRLLDRDADAEKSFRSVLELRPKSVPATTGLGLALFDQGRRDEAESVLRDAVDLDKKNVAALRALGEVLGAMGKGGEGRTLLAKAWRLDTKNALTAVSLVEIHIGHNDAASALKVAKTLIKGRREHPAGHFLLGLALEHKGKWKDAIEAYEAAIERDDTYIDAHKNLAIVCQTRNPMYRDSDLLEKSMKHYERFFELGGKDPGLRRVYDQMSAFLKHLQDQQRGD